MVILLWNFFFYTLSGILSGGGIMHVGMTFPSQSEERNSSYWSEEEIVKIIILSGKILFFVLHWNGLDGLECSLFKLSLYTFALYQLLYTGFMNKKRHTTLYYLKLRNLYTRWTTTSYCKTSPFFIHATNWMSSRIISKLRQLEKEKHSFRKVIFFSPQEQSKVVNAYGEK